MKKIVSVIFKVLFFPLALIIGPSFALAQGPWTEINSWIPTNFFAMGGADLNVIIADLIRWLLVISAFVALFYAVLGGYQYITAGGDAEKATAGRTTLLNAIIGLIIIFASYALISFVVNQWILS